MDEFDGARILPPLKSGRKGAGAVEVTQWRFVSAVAGVSVRRFVVAGIAVWLLGCAAPALAQDQYPPTSCLIKVDTTVPVTGIRIFFCTGVGAAKSASLPSEAQVSRTVPARRANNSLKPESTVSVAVSGTGILLQVPVTADLVSLDVPLPSNLPAGDYTIVVKGITIDDKPLLQEIPITIDPTAPRVSTVGDGLTVITPGKTGAVEVQGVQISSATTPIDGATVPTYMMLGGAGLLVLLTLAGLGAIGYTTIVRART